MKLKIPVLANWKASLIRWGSEIRAIDFLTSESLIWKDYEPTFSASGAMTFTRTSSLRAKYLEVGDLVFLSVQAVGTLAGVASSAINFSLPVPSTEGSNGSNHGYPMHGYVVDNGAVVTALSYTQDSGLVAVLRYDAANWTAAPTTGQTFAINGFYVRG